MEGAREGSEAKSRRGRVGLWKVQLVSCREEVPSSVKLVSSCHRLRILLGESVMAGLPMAVSSLKGKQRWEHASFYQGYMESFLFLICFWQS